MLEKDAEAETESSTTNAAKQTVCDAAIRCFQQYGPQRTSMADIADEAGISRKTLYRLFDDRPTLIEHILNQRLNEMGAGVKSRLRQFKTIEDALIEGSIESVAAGRQDKLFSEIVREDTNHRVEQFMFRGTDTVRKNMMKIWSPVLEEGRKRDLVRNDLTNERIVDLIQNVHALLFIRDDYGDNDQRAFLKDFLLPAILKVRNP